MVIRALRMAAMQTAWPASPPLVYQPMLVFPELHMAGFFFGLHHR